MRTIHALTYRASPGDGRALRKDNTLPAASAVSLWLSEIRPTSARIQHHRFFPIQPTRHARLLRGAVISRDSDSPEETWLSLKRAKGAVGPRWRNGPAMNPH